MMRWTRRIQRAFCSGLNGRVILGPLMSDLKRDGSCGQILYSSGNFFQTYLHNQLIIRCLLNELLISAIWLSMQNENGQLFSFVEKSDLLSRLIGIRSLMALLGQ